ncbi:MAG: AgmX/PglI C-terminal domain-containing protein [Chitinispirillaceae bacterium]|nr:AgmX/PglI C-terminal domain-containing protein [Chitinispirillaceae bacterium]
MFFFKPADQQLINFSCLLLLFMFASSQTTAARPDSIGGRSELSITEFIASKLPEFMRIYSARLLEMPGVGGKIDFNFAIDESGDVPFCNIVNSAIGDDTLENRLADFIMNWKFEKIDKPGDITVVTYPFDFSQESKRGGGALAVGTDTAAGRSKESIFRAIKMQSSEFKKIYRARLAEKPGLKGKIYFKFAINERGSVTHCRVDSSTVNDTTLEKRLAELISGWTFERSDTPGDILAVTYPFVFSPRGSSGIGVLFIAAAAIVSLCLLAVLLIE